MLLFLELHKMIKKIVEVVLPGKRESAIGNKVRNLKPRNIVKRQTANLK
jgi:hypothetical protein